MSPRDEIVRMANELMEKRLEQARCSKKDPSSKQTEQLVEVVGKKVKEAVKEAIAGLKEKDLSSRP